MMQSRGGAGKSVASGLTRRLALPFSPSTLLSLQCPALAKDQNVPQQMRNGERNILREGSKTFRDTGWLKHIPSLHCSKLPTSQEENTVPGYTFAVPPGTRSKWPVTPKCKWGSGLCRKHCVQLFSPPPSRIGGDLAPIPPGLQTFVCFSRKAGTAELCNRGSSRGPHPRKSGSRRQDGKPAQCGFRVAIVVALTSAYLLGDDRHRK